MAHEHLSAQLVLLNVALKLDPELGDPAQEPRIDCARQCAQSLQQLHVTNKIGGDHIAPGSVAASVWVGAGIRNPLNGATMRYCWINVFIESLMSFCEDETVSSQKIASAT